MGFVGNLVLFAAVKNFANRSIIDKVKPMLGWHLFLTHSVQTTWLHI